MLGVVPILSRHQNQPCMSRCQIPSTLQLGICTICETELDLEASEERANGLPHDNLDVMVRERSDDGDSILGTNDISLPVGVLLDCVEDVAQLFSGIIFV